MDIASGIFPAGCAFAGSSITCNLTVPRQPESAYPTYTEVCYNGSPPGKMTFNGTETIESVTAPIVNGTVHTTFAEGLPPACGVPGWAPIASSSGSGSGSGSGAPGSNVSGSGTGTGTGTGGPGAAKSWSHTLCKTTYKKWAKKHKHATHKQKKTEANSLHKSHGCPLSLLK